MERKFLVLLRRFRLQSELVLFYHLLFCCVAHFSVFAATRGALVSTFGGSSNLRANHTQTPTHSPLAFARAGCFGVCVCSLGGFGFERV